MSVFPREEIDYEKLYKNLDLDRDLKINWPDVEKVEPIEIIIEDSENSGCEVINLNLIECDEEFCNKNRIDENFYKKTVQNFEIKNWEKICKKLDKIKYQHGNESCDICGNCEEEDENKIITCQGCYISVHEGCYGVFANPGTTPDNSESGVSNTIAEPCRWMCKKCIFYFEDGNCMFCNKTSGILKKTENGSWGHVVCALLHQSLSFCNMILRDPIEFSAEQGIGAIKNKGICTICNEPSRYLINCSYEGCNVAYHASCCSEVFYSDLNNSVTYCDLHDPIKNYKCLQSRRNAFKDIEMYSTLSESILLRTNVEFQEPKNTKFLKIAKKPVHLNKSDLQLNKKTLQIFNFWKKHKSIFNFSNIFQLSNHFLKER
jgi:hypothetical protein